MSTEAEYVEDAISSCCGASVLEPDVCAECLEHCSPEFVNEPPEDTPGPFMRQYAKHVIEELKNDK